MITSKCSLVAIAMPLCPGWRESLLRLGWRSTHKISLPMFLSGIPPRWVTSFILPSSLMSALFLLPPLSPLSHTPLLSQDAIVSGRNVYGILRAGRSLGTESIILTAPLLDKGRNHHGIAVMLALAEYFQSQLVYIYT